MVLDFWIDSAHGNFICLTLKGSLKLIHSLIMDREVGAQNGDWKMAVPTPWCEDSSESEERELRHVRASNLIYAVSITIHIVKLTE
ncbi:hypothetical protein GUJ93_ZPchr0008g13628 [Zizania palustris]|uniref:Uncharacterized protein n=1 Tax=Zizania palustris TaxID=103762 RepID=A0A8J5RIK0_ZIZPA|nr:hypothetical protein GUJ93_ZPchr0008g13628 [Zizania palustris]